MWNNGTRLAIRGVFVEAGTSPAGSMWAMNPIPRIDFDNSSSGQPAGWRGCTLSPHGDPVGPACRQFDPPCSWDDGWYAQPPWKHNIDVEGACSGDWTGGVIVDEVYIPRDLPAGDYVLGKPAQTLHSHPEHPLACRSSCFRSLAWSGWRWDCEESTQCVESRPSPCHALPARELCRRWRTPALNPSPPPSTASASCSQSLVELCRRHRHPAAREQEARRLIL